LCGNGDPHQPNKPQKNRIHAYAPQLSFADYDTFSTILSPNTFVYPVKNSKHPKVGIGMLLICPYRLAVHPCLCLLVDNPRSACSCPDVLLSVFFSGAIRPCAWFVVDVLVREVVLGVYGVRHAVTHRAVLDPMADFSRGGPTKHHRDSSKGAADGRDRQAFHS